MRRLPWLSAVAFVLSVVGPSPAAGQTASDRAAACVSVGGAQADCAAAAVALWQVTSQMGLMASPGSEIPGEGSTLGRRLGGTPRVAAWLRGGVHPLAVPAPGSPNGPDEGSAWTPSLQAGLGLGLFDGIQLLPTMGGFLSLDVVGHASFVFLSEDVGFAERVNVYSVGARVGLLRESFTLPGVTLSVARRFSDRTRLGDVPAGDEIEVITDPSITSYRLTVSKDLLAFGVLAGFGWDDFSSEAQLVVSDGVGAPLVSTGSVDGRRGLYFASVTKQLGVLAWVTVEGGWARGFDPVAGYAGGFDTEGGSLFGSLTLLLKL